MDLVGALGDEQVDAVGDFDRGVEHVVAFLGGLLRVGGGDAGFHLGNGDVLRHRGEGGTRLLDGGGDLIAGDTVAVLRGRDGEGFLIGSDDDLGVFHFRGQGGVHGRSEFLDGVLADGGHGFQGAAGEEGTDERRQGGRAFHGLIGGCFSIDGDAGFVERDRGVLSFDGERDLGGVGSGGDRGDDLVAAHAFDGDPGNSGAGQDAARVVGRVYDDGADDK